MNFGAYVLSTTDGFSFIPFAVETVCKLLEGKESLLDLNSMLGLKAGHIVMRYQNIAIPNKSLHAYSIYQGAQEINAGRDGSFIGVTFIFEEKIDLEKIALGQKLKYFIDGLSGLFILNKRFIKKIDIKTVGEFCENDYYKNIMLSVIKDAGDLHVTPSASGKYKNIFFHTKQDLYTSFNAICNSNRIMFNEFYLMGLPNERYVSTAKNIFHSVSEWPMPYIKTATQQNNAWQQNAQPVQRQEQLQNGRKNKTREYVQNETQYDIDWESYLKIAGIALIAILALCVLIFFSYSIGYYKGKMTDESKKISKNDIQKINELIDETGNNYRLILSKLAAIEEKINDGNGQNVDIIMDAVEGAQRRAASELSGKDRKDIKKLRVQPNNNKVPQ